MIQADSEENDCMINGKRIAVVFPAYNAEKTLEATVRELPDLVDIRILVDDHSSDRTSKLRTGSACSRSSTTAITATAAISRPVTERLWLPARTWSSWFIPITSTRRCW
jgi:hypothetical protein